MKKFLSLITIILLPLLAMAQTQQGYVKTLGRQDNAGKPLSGVTIRQTGAHNAVVSNASGTFSLNMSGKKLGDPYSLQQVRKDKYELVEHDAVGRKYAYSNSVPLTIVMVSTEQLEKDKMRIENNAYKRAEKDYKTKSSALEKQLKEKTISEEKYQQKFQALINNFDKYQSMIESLADHYARTDYDALDEREREINICIENGDLERADSLLHTIDDFDPIEVLKRNKEAMAKFDAQIAQAEGMIAEANADMAEVLRRQEKDAEYLYQLYTIALARYDNEKAAKYIETRAALDTTNVDWQLEAGEFIQDYLANYDKALKYYNCALRNAIKRYGDKHSYIATIFNNIGISQYRLADYDMALTYFQKAMDIELYLYGDSHPRVAICHNNISSIDIIQGNYQKGLISLYKVLDILLQEYGENNHLTMECLRNIGEVHRRLGNLTEAIINHQKALEIGLQIYDESHIQIALCHNCIGGIYYAQHNIKESFYHFEKALKTYQKTLGFYHPDIATSYTNIGLVYNLQGNHDLALTYFKNALDIYLQFYEDKHPIILEVQKHIGSTYLYQENYAEALRTIQNVLQNYHFIYGDTHIEIGILYDNIGAILSHMNNEKEALHYYQMALKQYESLGNSHINIAVTYFNIGRLYGSQKKYVDAYKYYRKALNIYIQSLNENHPNIMNCYNELGYICQNLGLLDEAISNYIKCLTIKLNLVGKNHADIAILYDRIANIYYEQKKHSKALEYYQLELPILKEMYGEGHQYTINIMTSILHMYLLSGEANSAKYNKFMENAIFIGTVIDNKTPAAVQGLSGSYYIFEFNDWSIDSNNILLEWLDKSQGKPKNIVLMKEGKVSSHYFENSIGCQFGVKWISKEKKQQILEQYRKWKESQN